ncbi:MAG TPA: response regulator [Dongiaceae bacterium]|nr:response regulator [Dongiaceae bacterium]
MKPNRREVADGTPVRILHLEDDPNDRDLTHAALDAGGLEAEIVTVSDRGSYEAALRDGTFDLILSDFSVPGLDGLGALALAQERFPDIPFVLISGTLDEDSLIALARGGVTDYVVKHRLARLVPAVRRALEEATARRHRAEMERSLEAERHFLKALLESLEEGIVACDAGGTLTLFNRATREIHGLPEEPLPPEHWANHYGLFQPDGRTPMGKEDIPLYRALHGARLRGLEMVVIPKGVQPRRILASAQPIVDAEGRRLGAVAAFHDITEQRNLEAQFRQAQKMEAVGRLAGGVAHDFNNLLSVILGYTELVLAAGGVPDRTRESLEEVLGAGRRAVELTRQLLAFSRKQIIEPRVLDLGALVHDMEKMLGRVIGEDIRLATRLAAGLGRVRADPGQVEQIVMNLVVNARDAMPHGGALTLETADRVLDEAFVRDNLGAQSGSYVMLSVSDTGTGIPLEIQGKIFEPFFTTKGEGKGTGLGLATVYGIVKQNGGYIQVESGPGKGTAVRIFLPLVQEEADPLVAGAIAPPARGSETILLVEDEPSLRQLAAEALRGYGYTVLEAGDGAEALRLCEGHPGPIHLLLADFILPGVRADELARQAAATHPESRVLYMSGYTDDALVRDGVLEPGVALLQKPFETAHLARRVREILDTPLARAA